MKSSSTVSSRAIAASRQFIARMSRLSAGSMMLFALVAPKALGSDAPVAAANNLLAGSMKWFEQEYQTSICHPSPVNRLVRPAVCLGFEMNVDLVALNAVSVGAAVVL